MLNKWNHDVSQKCWLNKLLMKKFQKPLALELKHFTQRKWVNFYWNKMEELFIGKLNSPCFQFQIEYTLQTNCLLQQWLKLYTAIKNPPKPSWKEAHMNIHSAMALTQEHHGTQLLGDRIPQQTWPWCQPFRKQERLQNSYQSSPFPLLFTTLYISWNIFLHYWSTKPQASWAQADMKDNIT